MPAWTRWMYDLMNTEYTFGSQQRSYEYGEKLLETSDLARRSFAPIPRPG